MVQAVDRVLAALADPTRRAVVDILKDGPRRAGDLAAALATTPPALSRHLKVLRTRGLVAEERLESDARVRVFRLRREPFDALGGWLAAVEGFWRDQLDAFAAHAERAAGSTAGSDPSNPLNPSKNTEP